MSSITINSHVLPNNNRVQPDFGRSGCDLFSSHCHSSIRTTVKTAVQIINETINHPSFRETVPDLSIACPQEAISPQRVPSPAAKRSILVLRCAWTSGISAVVLFKGNFQNIQRPLQIFFLQNICHPDFVFTSSRGGVKRFSAGKHYCLAVIVKLVQQP